MKTVKVRESKIEEYLRLQVKNKLGGKAYKFNSMSNRGVPDRLCVFPNGTMVFVEVKAPEKKLTPLQAKVISELRALKAPVAVVKSKEGVDKFINAMLNTLKEKSNAKKISNPE